MFISSDTYHEKILSAIAESDSICVAVAFWGSGSERLLREFKGHIRIICNLLAGGTNPEPIDLLSKQKNVEVRHSSTLHAKVLIGSKGAVVGSANFSANGLHYENGELEGWEEAGVEVHDSATIDSLRKWYDELWNRSKIVLPADIELARYRWGLGRDARSILTGSGGILDAPVHAFKDRAIFLALYMTESSPEANIAFDEVLTHRPKAGKLSALQDESLSYYESWRTFPEEALIIDVLVGPRYSVSVNDLYSRIPSLDCKFKYNDGSNGSLHIVVRQTRILGGIWNSKSRRDLCKLLQPRIRNIMTSVADPSDPSICISLYDALK